MGQGALRSQMDVRVCFRVRERRDVDLILGQGMLAAGWQAHKLNAPGKFLISAPEQDVPRRARAYLLTDRAVSDTAAWHVGSRPALDEVSQRAIAERAQARPESPAHTAEPGHREDAGRAPAESGRAPDDPGRGPEMELWLAFSLGPAEGVTVPELMDQTGMSRPWVYQRLHELTRRGQAIQVSRGRWRADTASEPDAG
jgi:S-DNA-T family DNA segregation ATPase FtsK/SpoIIIE